MMMKEKKLYIHILRAEQAHRERRDGDDDEEEVKGIPYNNEHIAH
jgi:hypothetical protein